jgi:NADH-quinone oxidoreductase subunit N
MNYADLFRVTLPETALEVAALIILIVDLGFLRKAELKVRVTVAALSGVAGCGVALWTISLQNGSGFFVDGWEVLAVGPVTIIAQVGILVLTAFTLFLLIDETFTGHVGEFVAVVLMGAAGGLVVSAAQDLLVIFIGLELLSLSLYILTAFAKRSGKSAEAALKYYLFGGMSAAFLLFGFSYLYGLGGSTNLIAIKHHVDAGAVPLLCVAWVLVVAGLGFKVAAVPFQLWAPDTYEGAPIPSAAFIASVSKVASFTLLINICFGLLAPGYDLWAGYVQAVNQGLKIEFSVLQPLTAVLLVVAASSMVFGNLAALAQVSVRRLLAYSAIAHAGYILLGIGVYQHYNGEPDALRFAVDSFRPVFASTNAVLFYILTYGLTTIGAFGVVSVVERATGSDRLDSFRGLHKRNPLLAAVLLVLFLSLAGIPPLVGFWAKFNLFAAVLGVSAGPVPFALVALAVALSAVSLYYYLQVLKRAYVMPAIDESPIKAHPVTMAVLLVIAAAVVVLGCFPALLQNWIASFYPAM